MEAEDASALGVSCRGLLRAADGGRLIAMVGAFLDLNSILLT